MKLSILYVLTSVFFTTLIGEKTDTECTKNGVCLPRGYERREMPTISLHVNVEITWLQVTEVDDLLSTVDILVYLSFFWEDKRITLLNHTEPQRSGHLGDGSGVRHGEDWYLLYDEWYEKLWLPDVYIYGLKKVKFQEYRDPNSGK